MDFDNNLTSGVNITKSPDVAKLTDEDTGYKLQKTFYYTYFYKKIYFKKINQD